MNELKLKYLHFDTVESTNTLASKYLEEASGENWLVLSADSQSEGRGQRGTTWQDIPGQNVLMSVVSPPLSWPVSRVFDVNMAVSKAIFESLTSLVPVRLKWPNDILVGSQKLGGVLIEPTLRGSFVQRLVIGIGINVYQREWEAGVVATSLSQEAIMIPDLDEIRKALASEVARQVERLLKTGVVNKEEYLSRCLGYKKFMTYSKDGKNFMAKLVDVDPSGRQILEDEKGRRTSYDLKEVQLQLHL